jgi:hypothetical protein
MTDDELLAVIERGKRAQERLGVLAACCGQVEGQG